MPEEPPGPGGPAAASLGPAPPVGRSLDDPALAAAVRERVAASWPASRSRTSGSTSRTVTASATTPRRTGTGPEPPPRRRGAGRGHPAAVRRPAGQVLRRRTTPARRPHAGRDLHPAQLPSRYAAVYAWHLDGFDQAAARVRAFHAGAAGPGGVLDEPATVTALVAQVRRAVHCGAVPEAEALARTGLDHAALLGG